MVTLPSVRPARAQPNTGYRNRLQIDTLPLAAAQPVAKPPPTNVVRRYRRV